MRTSFARISLVACCALTLVSGSLSGIGPGKKKKSADPVGDLRAAITKEVADPARAAAMSASVDAMARATGEIGALATRQKETIQPMLRDYGSSRGDIEAKLAEFEKQRKALSQKLLEAHLAFKSQATPAEWGKLRKVEEQAVANAAIVALGQGGAEAKEK